MDYFDVDVLFIRGFINRADAYLQRYQRYPYTDAFLFSRLTLVYKIITSITTIT